MLDHAERGAWIARAWALPDSLVRAIGEHGRPGADADTVVYAVPAADVAATSVGAGTGRNSCLADSPDGETFARAMDKIGLTAAAFELRLLVDQRLSEVERRFDAQPASSGEGRDHPV